MTDLTPNDLSHLSDAEFHALCPQGEHAPGPEPLSPAAQAILAAMHRSYDHEPTRRLIAAGILRALADAVVPEETSIVTANDFRRQRRHTRRQILSITAELENIND